MPSLSPYQLVLTSKQLRRLKQAIAAEDYDPAAKMLRHPFSSPGYHTKLQAGMVHRTRESFIYAVALLDSGEQVHHRQAVEILRRVVALQDQNPVSPTYGIWPWFLEESLEEMSPPDWNWADFCGAQLLEAILTHRHRLPDDLAQQIDQAIGHAANSIQRRNVTLRYTNIAIMGTFVTLVAAEAYCLPHLLEYALDRLRRFGAYTAEQGAFSEYNSPCYTIVALNEITRMRKYVKHTEARGITDQLYRIAWQEIADHFHAPTRQWAGPHSRCYHTLLDEEVLGLIRRATGDRFPFPEGKPSLDEHRLAHECPAEWESRFIALDQPRALTKTFLKETPSSIIGTGWLPYTAATSPFLKEAPSSMIGTTYLHPAFTLGTINRGDLWNQRRSLVAYWGTGEKPAYLHLRLLHDGYDFSAAQFFSVQHEGDALAAIGFATDGCDRHCCLDPIREATFRAKDLRLRFEFGGDVDALVLRIPSKTSSFLQIQVGSAQLHLAVPYALWGETTGVWESGQDEGRKYLDVVLYSGDEEPFCLTKLHAAALAVAIRITTDSQRPPPVKVEGKDSRLRVDWGPLHVDSSRVPRPLLDLHQTAIITNRKKF